MLQFKLESAFVGFEQKWALINLPANSNAGQESDLRTYLVNTLHPTQRIEISKRIKPHSDTHKLFVQFPETSDESFIPNFNNIDNYTTEDSSETSPAHCPTFLYIFNNELFKITGAQAVKVLDFSPDSPNQVLIINSNKDFAFFSFSTEDTLHSSDHTPNHRKSTELTFLGGFNESFINYDHYNDSLTLEHLKFAYQAPYYYLISHICMPDKAVALKVSYNSLEHFCILTKKSFVPNYATSKQVCSENPEVPKYIVTSTGIFDFATFTFYNLEKLYSILNTNFTSLSYRIFTTSYGKNILFVSDEHIPFYKLEHLPHEEFKNGITVAGALYDLDEQHFIFPAINSFKATQKWLMFFLYNDAIPHIFRINSTDYGIIFWDEKHNRFSKFISKELPKLVSYIATSTSEDTPDKKQIIFANIYSKRHHKSSINSENGFEEINANNIMLTISYDLEVLLIDYGLKLKSIFLSKTHIAPVDKDYVCLFSKPKSLDQSDMPSNVFHLYGDDVLILKSYKYDFGEFALMYLKDKSEVNFSLSFFDYCTIGSLTNFEPIGYSKNASRSAIDYPVPDDILRVVTRKNDFENSTYFINLQTKQIFDYEQFVSYITAKLSLPV